MFERLIRSVAKFVVLVAFTMALPGLTWWAHFNRGRTGINYDAVDFIRYAAIPLSPCCVVLWYILLSHVVLGRRSSFFVQFLLFACTIFIEYELLSRGIWI